MKKVRLSRIPRYGASLALLVLVAACGQAAAPGPASTPVSQAAVTVKVIPDPATIGTFVAPAVTIKAGETVRWEFQDLNPHTVSSAGFSSEPLTKGKSYSHTFTKPGTYMYHCAIHPEMLGSVTVS